LNISHKNLLISSKSHFPNTLAALSFISIDITSQTNLPLCPLRINCGGVYRIFDARTNLEECYAIGENRIHSFAWCQTEWPSKIPCLECICIAHAAAKALLVIVLGTENWIEFEPNNKRIEQPGS